MKKALPWLKYFVFLLLFALVVWLKGTAEATVQTGYSTTGKVNYLLYTIVLLLPIVAGAVIGLETFLNERVKSGKWKLNLPKLILIIIPSLYVSSIFFIAMIKSQKVFDIFITPIYTFFSGNQYFILMFQAFLGYSLITLFYKSDSAKTVVIEEDKPYDEVYDKESREDYEALDGAVYSTETELNGESDTAETIADEVTSKDDK